jgi:hypothetical protein
MRDIFLISSRHSGQINSANSFIDCLYRQIKQVVLYFKTDEKQAPVVSLPGGIKKLLDFIFVQI